MLPTDSKTDRYGVKVGNLQEDIRLWKDTEKITGRLFYVEDAEWAPDTWSEEQEKGNFIALDLKDVVGEDLEDPKIKVEIDPGDVGEPVDATDDGWIVIRVKNNEQVIRISVYDGEEEKETTEYSLEDLILDPEPGKG